MTLVANDTVTSQMPFAVGNFIPALQREDGSYVGADGPLRSDGDPVDGNYSPTAVDLSGNVLFHNTSLGVKVVPLYATADGGAIFSSGAINLCNQGLDSCTPLTSAPTLDTLDQNGNQQPTCGGIWHALGKARVEFCKPPLSAMKLCNQFAITLWYPTMPSGYFERRPCSLSS